MLGVATLIIVMAVMNGFRAELLTRILGINGHLVVQPIDRPLDDYDAVAKRIAGVAGVKYVLPLIEGQVLASGTAGNSTGALVRGVRAEDLTKLTLVSDNIKAGSLVGFATGEGVAIGSRMAQNLGLTIGDPHHPGFARRRCQPVRHHAARQDLSGGGDLRDRHVRIRRLDRVHAAQRGAALLQSGRQGPEHRHLPRQSRQCRRA